MSSSGRELATKGKRFWPALFASHRFCIVPCMAYADSRACAKSFGSWLMVRLRTQREGSLSSLRAACRMRLDSFSQHDQGSEDGPPGVLCASHAGSRSALRSRQRRQSGALHTSRGRADLHLLADVRAPANRSALWPLSVTAAVTLAGLCNGVLMAQAVLQASIESWGVWIVNL